MLQWSGTDCLPIHIDCDPHHKRGRQLDANFKGKDRILLKSETQRTICYCITIMDACMHAYVHKQSQNPTITMRPAMELTAGGSHNELVI